MTDFTKLRAYLDRIVEVAEEDWASVVSLGVLPAAKEALKELDRLEQENNKPNSGKRSAPEYPPATPPHLRTDTRSRY